MKNLIELVLRHKNWTGLTIEALAKGGRLAGSENKVSKEVLNIILGDVDNTASLEIRDIREAKVAEVLKSLNV